MPTLKIKFRSIDELVTTVLKACEMLNSGADVNLQIKPEDILIDKNKQKLDKLFRSQAMRHHPDRNGGVDKDGNMKTMNDAHDALEAAVDSAGQYDKEALLKKIPAKAPQEKRELTEEEHKPLFLRELTEFQKIIANTDERIASANNVTLAEFFSNQVVVENLRMLSFKKELSIDNLTKLYNARFKGHPERLEVLRIFNDPTFLAHAAQQHNPFWQIKKPTLLEKMECFFAECFDKKRAWGVDFLEKQDLSLLQKFYLYYFVANGERYKEERTALNRPAGFLDDIKWQLIREMLDRQVASPSPVSSYVNEPALAKGFLPRLFWIVDEFNDRKKHHYFGRLCVFTINQQIISAALQKKEELVQERAVLVKRLSPGQQKTAAEEEKEISQKTKIKVIDNKIQAADNVLSEIKTTIKTTLQEEKDEKNVAMYSSDFQGASKRRVCSNIASPQHLFSKTISIVEKYADSPGAAKSQKPLGDFFRGLLGVCIGLIGAPVLIVSSSARRKFMHTFFHTKTQAAFHKGVENAGEASEQRYEQAVQVYKRLLP